MLAVDIEMVFQYAFVFSFSYKCYSYKDNKTTEPYISAKQIGIKMKELHMTALSCAARVPGMSFRQR